MTDDYWDIVKDYIDVRTLEELTKGKFVGETEPFYDEELDGYVSFKIYEIDGIKHICSSKGWVIRNRYAY
jgi:hypothetical protein